MHEIIVSCKMRLPVVVRLITSAKEVGGGYVFTRVCLLVSLLLVLRKNLQSDFNEILQEGCLRGGIEAFQFW